MSHRTTGPFEPCSRRAPARRLASLLAAGSTLASTFASTFASTALAQSDGALEARVKALEEAAAKRSKEALTLSWKDGLRMENADQTVQLRLGGRMQFDTFFNNSDDDGSALIATGEDGSQMRRARLALQGKLQKYFDFKWEYDFADRDGKTKVADLFAGFSGVEGVPDFRVGHFREPFGLEALCSANDLLFMERGLPFALVPFRNLGMQFSKPVADERVTWAAGVFRDSSDQAFGQANGSYAVTSRVTALPWCTAKRDHLLHVGLSGSRRAPPGDLVVYRSKPEANLALDFVDTKPMGDVDSVTLLGTEMAILLDRFSVQGEWVQSDVARSHGKDDSTFAGWYAASAWTLTGEPRRYKSAEGAFAAPKPAHSLFEEGGGFGAVELAARMSRLDLDGGDVDGGELRDLTVGVNWYATPLLRTSVNLIHAKLDTATDHGKAKLLEFRFQFAF